MCNPKPSSPSSFVSPHKTHFINPNNMVDDHHHLLHTHVDDDDVALLDQLHRWPTPSEALEEVKAIGKISGPTALTGLLLYSRAMISMLFLFYLELAGGSLAIEFANITGYSVLSGSATSRWFISAVKVLNT